jgi:hypothetical protein
MDYYTILLLVLGVPLIVWLTFRAVRRVREITARIKDVQEELAKNPQAAAQGIAEIMAKTKPPPKRKTGARKDK